MKKFAIVFTSILLVLSLSACGKKTKADVKAALDEKVKEISGYRVKGKMKIKVGAEPQTYNVEVWYKAPNAYRVSLSNKNKNQKQIILKNKQGVYVLTPALNKSFKFQSDWPNNGGQAYLYQSLVNDILADKKSTFKESEKNYSFRTKTRYANNKTLPLQEIVFDKNSLAPKSVKVMDADQNSLVSVDFGKMEFNPKFGADAFDVKKNMTGAQLEIPVMADGNDDKFSVKYPSENITGVVPTGQEMIETPNGKQMVLTFEGKGKSYTLIESKAKVSKAISALIGMGDPIDLGFTVGSVTNKSLSWTYEGVDYLLASNDLTHSELVEVALSVHVNPEK